MSLPLVAAVPAMAAPPPENTGLAMKADGKVQRQLTAKDKVTFWVQLDSEADTSAARKEKTKTGRGRAVLKAKAGYAERTQAGLRGLLKRADAPYRSFWISNSLKVTGGRALAEEIAARPEVASIEADDPIKLPDPRPGRTEEKVDSVEWNVDRINAPRAWNELGARGDGIVVANIDTGVDYRHPALMGRYRGLKADGSYDHAYNWFDPAKVCTGGAPCDNHGHGTHTMGTMVGDDHAANQIGVAPGAQWIAAKGCESGSCSRTSLMASGQWVVAPTDANGQNPRPDLAPDVVNNSWGATGHDAWFKETVQTWRDAGIFPAFSNGNSGPACRTAGSPGDYSNSYASGAFDSSGAIASFSSRGTGEDGTIKPNLAAPGVNIRSAAPGGGYQSMSGTSMASPHTAATVALMWSASPAIRGDIPATEALLDQSAVDTADLSCGGTAAKNNVWGEGKLEAYNAVSATPRGPLGAVKGTVTAGGQPLADATVAFDGPMEATVRTGPDGSYTVPKVMTGDYRITVTKFGYLTGEGTVTVIENETATKDLTLTAAPSGRVTGTVRTGAGIEVGARLAVQGTDVSTTSGTDGGYALSLPVGSYQMEVTPDSRCASAVAVALEVTEGSSVKDVELPSRTDAFGTTCRPGDAAFPAGETKTALKGTSGGVTVDLPFPVGFYGETYNRANVTVEGVMAFGASSTSSVNGPLPSTSAPNGALYPFWDNLQMDADSGVYTATRGTAPHREYIVEWRDMIVTAATSQRLSFAAVISEDGGYSFHYKDIGDGAYEQGSGATIGAENHTGLDALQYSYNTAGAVKDGLSLAFRPSRSATVSGTVTDENDGLAVEGATVTVRRDGAEVGRSTTTADGHYLVQVPADASADYQVEITKTHYGTATRTATMAAGSVSRAGTALRTGLVKAAPDAGWELVIPAKQTRHRTLELANSGSATDFTVKEQDGAGWLTAQPAAGTLEKDGRKQVKLTFDTTGAEPGTVLRGTVEVASGSGRKPVLEIPVTVAVPAYQTALNAGAQKSHTDRLEDTWGPDQAYRTGSYGYLGTTGHQQTTKTVTGTEEQALFSTARTGAYEYRFDGLPDGVYQVELGFAELTGASPSQRVFTVLAEGVEKVPHLDIAADVGGYAALTKTFTVRVTDGQLNLRLSDITGKTLVNAVRVSHRPDLTG
ncbi:S8 family serine peptidase [Streptomyces sp. NPDC058045]|uniref:S8 family serine peptidase n=1 Tax=Streptomyces sp. NPDC058045 TaxID=3346311 RepID=UPI0036EE78FB